MSILKKLFGGASKVTFLGKEVNNNSTYEVYRTTDKITAQKFLAGKKVTKPLYFIIVETPDGNWGLDVLGLFMEKLLPWQSNMSLAQCVGKQTNVRVFAKDVEQAAKGVTDNFVEMLQCGNCKNEWQDGIRHGETVVKCPKCKKYNKIVSIPYISYQFASKEDIKD